MLFHVTAPPARRRCGRCGRCGFTLIELLVALAVIAILAAVAIPAFTDSVRKGRRSDAFTTLAVVQQAQERWRSNNGSYAALENTATGGDPANGLGISPATAAGYYTVSLADVNEIGYTAIAVAVADKSQASDSGCQVLATRMASGNLAYGSSSTVSTLSWTAANIDPQRCWAR